MKNKNSMKAAIGILFMLSLCAIATALTQPVFNEKILLKNVSTQSATIAGQGAAYHNNEWFVSTDSGQRGIMRYSSRFQPMQFYNLSDVINSSHSIQGITRANDLWVILDGTDGSLKYFDDSWIGVVNYSMPSGPDDIFYNGTDLMATQSADVLDVISNSSYNNKLWPLPANIDGMTYLDGFYYLGVQSNDIVMKADANGIVIENSTELTSTGNNQKAFVTGIANNGSSLITVASNGYGTIVPVTNLQTFHRWSLDGIGTLGCRDITIFSGSMYCITDDSNQNIVHKLYLNGSFTGDFYDLSHFGAITTRGITNNGSNILVSDDALDMVFVLDGNMEPILNYSITGATSALRGLDSDASSYWMKDSLNSGISEFDSSFNRLRTITQDPFAGYANNFSDVIIYGNELWSIRNPFANAATGATNFDGVLSALLSKKNGNYSGITYNLTQISGQILAQGGDIDGDTLYLAQDNFLVPGLEIAVYTYTLTAVPGPDVKVNTTADTSPLRMFSDTPMHANASSADVAVVKLNVTIFNGTDDSILLNSVIYPNASEGQLSFLFDFSLFDAGSLGGSGSHDNRLLAQSEDIFGNIGSSDTFIFEITLADPLTAQCDVGSGLAACDSYQENTQLLEQLSWGCLFAAENESYHLRDSANMTIETDNITNVFPVVTIGSIDDFADLNLSAGSYSIQTICLNELFTKEATVYFTVTSAPIPPPPDLSFGDVTAIIMGVFLVAGILLAIFKFELIPLSNIRKGGKK